MNPTFRRSTTCDVCERTFGIPSFANFRCKSCKKVLCFEHRYFGYCKSCLKAKFPLKKRQRMEKLKKTYINIRAALFGIIGLVVLALLVYLTFFN